MATINEERFLRNLKQIDGSTDKISPLSEYMRLHDAKACCKVSFNVLDTEGEDLLLWHRRSPSPPCSAVSRFFQRRILHYPDRIRSSMFANVSYLYNLFL